MEDRAIKIKANTNHNVKINILPGHFATNHSHVNYFIDMTSVKTSYRMAREAAKDIAKSYSHNTYIDTIICLEGTEMIGAFLAETLGHHGNGINSGNNITVVTPESNNNNQLIFRDNIQSKIENKRILMLIASASTGKTINRSVECLSYYGGTLVGIASIFSAIKEFNDIPIVSVFHTDDMPEYKSMPSSKCEMCACGEKVEAIINSFGYSKI